MTKMHEYTLLVAGFFIGAILNYLWYKFEIDKNRGDIPLIKDFEHYHHAIILGYLAKWIPPPLPPLLAGIAIALLLDEAYMQKHKFAVGSNHFKDSLILTYLILSIIAVVELLCL